MGFRSENIASHDYLPHSARDGPAFDFGDKNLTYSLTPCSAVDDEPHDLDSVAGNEKVALFGGNPATKAWLFLGRGHRNEMIRPGEQCLETSQDLAGGGRVTELAR
jgi:hypothetical protein